MHFQITRTESPAPFAPLRSMLFIPADSERKLAKGEATGADALILDLEDAVAPSRTHIAREMAVAYLRSRSQRTGHAGIELQ